MGRTQHKESTRICPGCNKAKTFPIANTTCSRECAARLSQANSNGEKMMKVVSEVEKDIALCDSPADRARLKIELGHLILDVIYRR